MLATGRHLDSRPDGSTDARSAPRATPLAAVSGTRLRRQDRPVWVQCPYCAPGRRGARTAGHV